MRDTDNKEEHEPKVIVEQVPGKQTARYYAYSYTSARPVSGFRLALWLAAGALILCLALAVGALVLLLAVGTGLLYAAWRRLVGRR